MKMQQEVKTQVFLKSNSVLFLVQVTPKHLWSEAM